MEKQLYLKPMKYVNDNPKKSSPVLDKRLLFKKDFDSPPLKSGYLIFHIMAVADEYGLTTKRLLMLLYMRELKHFKQGVRVFNYLPRLEFYIKAGVIREDFGYRGDNVYCLTDFGLEIVDEFNKRINNSQEYVHDNRLGYLDSDTKLKSVLSDYFNN